MTRVAVLGMGRWGKTWCNVLARENFATVTAVAARSNAGEFADSDFVVFPDYREALAAADVDAAIVTLPVPEHLDAVRLCVDRAIPVLCEKPLVSNPADLQAMTELAASSSRPVRVNQNYRLREWAETTLRLLPRIGSLASVQVTFAQPEFIGGGRERLRHPLLADMSIHHVDLLRYLTGEEMRVQNARASRVPDARYAGDTDLSVSLRTDSGVEVRYDATWAARAPATAWDGDWVFTGTDGELSVVDLVVSVSSQNGSESIPTRPPESDNDLGLAWQEFRRAIAADQHAGVSVEDNARSLQLIFDAATAAGVQRPGDLIP